MNCGKKSVGEVVSLFQRELSPLYSNQEIRAILNQLFDDLMGWSRATVQLNKGYLLTEEVEHRFRKALGRLQEGEPIQYITGHIEFCGLTLMVQPGVLIPRPETEELAVKVTRDNQNCRDQHLSILDIGTGSGCLALAMKKAFPLARVTGMDFTPEALDVARQNALDNQLDVTFIEADILNPSSFQGSDAFHIILSNPPYIPDCERVMMNRQVVDYEPGRALFVPANKPLLFYEAISLFAKTRLIPNGLLYVEIHENYGEDIVNLFITQGFKSVELSRDLFGKKRFVRASLPG